MRVFRVACALLFSVGGGSLVLMSLLGGPSLWYSICFCALVVLGVVWLWDPRLAAALSVGPLISVVALLQYVSGMWLFSRIWAGAVVAGVIAALVVVAATLRGSSHWRRPAVLSLAFVTCAYATDRLFTNKLTVRTYQMYVALNGRAPWGHVSPEWRDGPAPIILYRRLGDSYCYDAFKSEELRQRLAPKDGHTVAVEYNIFSDFGKERSYNVRSVDGLLLENGDRTVRDFERFSGEILGNSGTSSFGADNCQ